TPTPTLNWTFMGDPEGDSISYTIDYSTSLNFDLTLTTTVTNIPLNNHKPTHNLQENATYYWRVWAIDSPAGQKTISSSTGTFRVNAVSEQPDKFSLFFTSGSIDNFNITFFWQDAVDPDPGDYIASYTLFYSTDQNFSIKQTSSGPKFPFSATPGNLINHSTYYWYVHAYDNTGKYSCSKSTWSLVIDVEYMQPINFDLSAPKNNSIVYTSTPTFSWGSAPTPTGDPVSYKLYLGDDGIVFPTIISDISITTYTYSIAFSLLENKKY
ncbi:unnamed protein product, partial [marine sediment metagenome]